MIEKQIVPLFNTRIRKLLEQAAPDYESLQELRLRIQQPMILQQNGRERYLTDKGELCDNYQEGICITAKDIKDIVEAACGYSGYAFEEEISRGYLTIAGGHRIGLAGRAVINENGVQTLKYISALNIRIAHPIKGCGEKWKKYIYEQSGPCHVLIISPPGCGKTTLLRDFIRMFSDGDEYISGSSVGVVDERSEIAGCYRGIPSHELGMRTDVLDGCPKIWGMEMMLRSMAPKVLAVDEIGISDVPAIETALRCGCKVLATLHGKNLRDFQEKPGFASLVKEKVFERYIFLKQGQTPGMVTGIYDRNFEILWEDKACI
ncbi:MAG: stage III sporulation protein AA [Lachnospiraceae bacterium]|nr:stage III sporulation protein AA [Lachnospiraceae bacterium]